MNILGTLVFEIAGVIAAVVFIQLVILAMRNPHRPDWLNGEPVQAMVAVLIVTLGCFTIGLLASGLVAAGMELFVMLAISAALPIAVAFLSARIFGFQQRLDRADAGESPFSASAGRQAKAR
jgi:hypothetical protein